MKNPFRSQTEQRAAAPAKPKSAGLSHKQLDTIARVIAKTMAPLQKRIAVLEKALEQEVQRSAAALSGDVDGFMDDDTRQATDMVKNWKGGAE